jgi:hypothetical protein
MASPMQRQPSIRFWVLAMDSRPQAAHMNDSPGLGLGVV